MSDEQNKKLQVVKEIDQSAVRFLAAGEKINDIETAIRELVENSIDANAKIIELSLCKFGIDSIEVDDNGTGIDEKNFPRLGLRYHTSKISDFKNLQSSLETYGFRGEAISCLCNIATVIISTKTRTSPHGWRLTFKDGSIVKQEKIGRDVGTSVTLKNIFHSMPVRRRELEMTAKKKHDKIVRLIYEQALARPHIRFILSKKTGLKKEKELTIGGVTLMDCMISTFTSKVTENLLLIRQEAGLGELAMKSTGKGSTNGDQNDHIENTQADGNYESVCSPSDSNGKQSMTTNECDLISNPAMSVTSESNASIYDVGTENDAMHTNGSSNSDETISKSDGFTELIAPSRDQIFFKRSRRSKFARERPQYLIHGYISKIGAGRNSNDQQYIFVNKKPCDLPRISRQINEIYRNFNRNNHYPVLCLFVEVQMWAADFNVPRKRGVILQEENKLSDTIKETLESLYSSYAPADQKSCPTAQIPLMSSLMPKTAEQKPATSIEGKSDGNTTTSERSQQPTATAIQRIRPYGTAANSLDRTQFEFTCNDVVDSIPDLFDIAPKRARLSNSLNDFKGRKENQKNNLGSNDCAPGFKSGLEILAEQNHATSGASNNSGGPNHRVEAPSRRQSENFNPVPTPNQRSTTPAKSMIPPPESQCRFNQTAFTQDDNLKVCIEYLEDLPLVLEREHHQRITPVDQKEFSFAIHPKFNTPAEEELKFHLNKATFVEMQVVGQFNRGFIIAKLNKHLFIVDQHATDERANFEEQLERSPLVRQAMVHPKPLYLSLIQENTILDNMEAFRVRGLEFEIDTKKTVGYRVLLSATSICRGPDRDEHLGKEDVEELVDVCIHNPNSLPTYTLSKVNTISASVACRKSVMIGDKLTWSKMDGIVKRMSNLRNPWVCAHNRPTIRHLMDTDWMEQTD